MITGPSSYISTMNQFLQHWLSANIKLAPKPVIIALPDKTTVTQAQFLALRDSLQTQQGVVQSSLTDVQIARGNVALQKAALLAKFGLFTALMDGYYSSTGFYAARPYAPGISDGKENFLNPLGAMMTVWAKINTGPVTPGVTLPLVLGDATTQSDFASALSALIFSYSDMENKEVLLQLERGERDVIQTRAYAVMKAYREVAPDKFVLFPELLETLPRLSPLPGHTPESVNASAIFQAPDQSKVVYEESTDAQLHSYELRGNVGTDYNNEDAVVIATNLPGATREFITPFGLTQPGAEVAMKVYVILTTGNEAGSAAMFVERPAGVQLLAA